MKQEGFIFGRKKPGRFCLVILNCANSKKPSWFDSESLLKPGRLL
jgi:hypothetical protein